jgi:hypothetical protein
MLLVTRMFLDLNIYIYILVRCPCVATTYKILVHNDYRKN